jgi:hypothetical protein
VAARFRFIWKWRRRSPVKITERTHEEATEAVVRKTKAVVKLPLAAAQDVDQYTKQKAAAADGA